MTASGSSSSASDPPEQAAVDLLAAGRLSPLVTAFLQDRDLDLLAPVRLWKSGGTPPWSGRRAPSERRALASALAVSNTGYGHPAADRLAEQLSDAETMVVVTGQQPGLFGGPLYTLSKAVAAVLWAERLREAGKPAVPLFWMATDDHDYREVSQAVFFTTPEPERFDLGEDGAPLMPVGLRPLGSSVTEVLDRLSAAVAGDRYETWLQQLGHWYRPEATFGEAFAGLLTHLLGERCPLLVDAMLPALKTAQRPWLRRIVERRAALWDRLASRDRQLAERGYTPQISPQPGTLPLFVLHEGERRRVEWRPDDRLSLRGSDEIDEPIAWLLDLLEREPQRVSPGVRARSAIQDVVLGSDLQIVGPGELSYLPQAAPLFELLDIPAPWAVLRPQVLVLEDHQFDKLKATGLTLEELLDPSLDVDARLARPEDTAFLAVAEEQLRKLLDESRDAAMGLDTDLERPWSKTGDQMKRALQAFRGKVTAAAARRDAISRQRIEALRSLCLPLGVPQERVIAVAHYPGKYGGRFVEAMFEQMKLDSANLQVVSP